MKLEFTERMLDEKTIVQARFHTTKLPGGENLLIIAFKSAGPVQRCESCRGFEQTLAVQTD